jgi:hypothetical protein
MRWAVNDFGLLHRDPKRIVGVLRLILLDRQNGSSEWAELPLSRQTHHHNRLPPYRGLQTPLFVLALGKELAHYLHPELSDGQNPPEGLSALKNKSRGKTVPSSGR